MSFSAEYVLVDDGSLEDVGEIKVFLKNMKDSFGVRSLSSSLALFIFFKIIILFFFLLLLKFPFSLFCCL